MTTDTATSHDAPNDLAAFTSIGNPEAPHRTLIYGPGGVGKSTFCASCSDVYVLPVEDGANQLRVPQWKEQIRSLPTLYKALTLVRDGRHPYKAIALDTVGATEVLICNQIEANLKGKKGAKTIAEMNEDYGAGHVAIADQWQLLLNAFDELREKRGMSILLIGHLKHETINNLEGKDYTHFTLDLSGRRSAKMLTNWCDNVLYARQDVSVVVDGKKVRAATGNLSLYTRGTGAWLAKTRGEIPWPERLPLDWATFDRVRDLIARHGKDLRRHLEGRFAAIVPSIPEAEGRRAKAVEVFLSFVNAGQWHLADAVVSQAEEEAIFSSPVAP